MEALKRLIDMPVMIEISRETGQVVKVERGMVQEKDMLRICGDTFAAMVEIQIQNNELENRRSRKTEGQEAFMEA